MRVLALDASTKSGWALFVDGQLLESGALTPVSVEDFNVNKDPQKSPKYPQNVMFAAYEVATGVLALAVEKHPDYVVIENTNKGKNRHTQRILEWLHLEMLRALCPIVRVVYMDTSEWRSVVGLWMTKDDLKNNRDVKAGKKRGKVTKKHLAVRMVNEKYPDLKLIQKDNDQADAILLGLAYVTRSQTTP